MDVKEFKKWLIDNDEDENELYVESIKCFQVESYKASFLFSYLGLMNYIRNLILNYRGVPKRFKENKNDDFRKRKWKEKVNSSNSENNWEREVFNIINEGADINIFLLDDNDRAGFSYNKTLRNSAVHNKDRKILYSTVEELREFISYIYPKLVIDGSLELLLKKYDYIQKFVIEDKYDEECNAVYSAYTNLKVDDRELFFKKLSEDVLVYIETYFAPGDYNKFSELLLEKMFERYEADEYKWIDDDFVKLFYYISLKNTNFVSLFDSNSEFLKFIYELDINKLLFILIVYGYDDKVDDVLNRMYVEKCRDYWFDIIESMARSLYNPTFDDEVLYKVVNLDFLRPRIEELENKLHCKEICDDNKIIDFDKDIYKMKDYEIRPGLIKLVLLLHKKEILSDGSGLYLKKFCEKVVKGDINFSSLYEELERNDIIFDWLKKQI